MKIFKKIIFWFFIMLSTLIVFGIINIITDKHVYKGTAWAMGLLLFIPWSIYAVIKLIKKDASKKRMKSEEYRKTLEKKYKGYILMVKYQDTMLFVNEANKQFILNETFYKFKDLISAEIVTNDTVVTTTHTQKRVSIGKALVGGSLFGVGGAIIGGTAGKKNQYQPMSKYVINYKLN